MEDSRKIKILMTADTVGGVWTYCTDLCNGLLQYDAEVHLVTMGAKMSEWQRKEVEALPNVSVYESEYRLEWMHDPWNDINECGKWLLELEGLISPDIVHLNCFAYGSLPFQSPCIVVAHSDVYSWFMSVKQEPPPTEWNPYFNCVKEGLAGANMVIAPSQWMADTVEEVYGADNCRVVYNGRNASLFYRKRKQRFVFSMGRMWDEAKNLKLLVDAAPNIGACVEIAGDQTFHQNSFGDSCGVEFPGKLSTGQIAEALSTAAVYALPARYEPFGLSALEAALSGCALVLGDIPSLREIWQDAALYVDTNDTEALADAVNELLADKELLNVYASKASIRAKLFSSEAMCREYLHLYHQLKQETKKELV
jgi:glycogen synthase